MKTLPVALEVVPRLRLRNHLKAWLPILFGVLVICGESTSQMSSSHTFHWLAHLLQRTPMGTLVDVPELNYALRKAGHLFGYGFLGLFFASGWHRSLTRRENSTAHLWLWSSVLGVLCATLVASLDELHQSFLPNREASVQDVLLDMRGAVLVVAVAAVCRWCSRNAAVVLQRDVTQAAEAPAV